MISISNAHSNFEREPLLNPFGFKGKSINELWQIVVDLQGNDGQSNYGLGVQSPLWSDPRVFVEYGETSSNCLMYLITEYALRLLPQVTFNTPIDLLNAILPDVYEYSQKITGNRDIGKTFALNALVAVDNAAWMLYSRENNISSFDDMIPKPIRVALSNRADCVANIPLISYNVSEEKIREIIEDGYPVLKIKIGSDPDKDGDKEKMLLWDQKRLLQVHNIAKNCQTPYTNSGNILYYLDANGQYLDKQSLLAFLDYAQKIGALDRIVLFEEPFPEDIRLDVHDVPVRLVADESAHTISEAAERIQMGYGAIALKPIAKTLSMSFQISELAYRKGIPCFCADLTVNPIMVDWNKNFAARLSNLPDIKISVLESNGFQNYANWERMKKHHPYCNASWTDTKNGVFVLEDEFYKISGGIFRNSEHYSSLVKYNF